VGKKDEQEGTDKGPYVSEKLVWMHQCPRCGGVIKKEWLYMDAVCPVCRWEWQGRIKLEVIICPLCGQHKKGWIDA
jgi:predicted RNA-binding Zn-ribbon protein involved in translation (DUF1610 family)